ncbi:MAG: helix-turn-helix domain-containing protein [Bacteroidota bacterium]
MQEVKDKKFLIKLGEKIRLLRLERNMTQLDLAIKINNYAEQIGRIERGELNSSICTLKLICSGLKIELKELFEGLN